MTLEDDYYWVPLSVDDGSRFDPLCLGCPAGDPVVFAQSEHHTTSLLYSFTWLTSFHSSEYCERTGGLKITSPCDLASSPSSPFFPFQLSLPRNHPSAAHARGSPPDYWTQIHVLMQHQASSFPSRLKYLGTRHRLRCDHILCR